MSLFIYRNLLKGQIPACQLVTSILIIKDPCLYLNAKCKSSESFTAYLSQYREKQTKVGDPHSLR